MNYHQGRPLTVTPVTIFFGSKDIKFQDLPAATYVTANIETSKIESGCFILDEDVGLSAEVFE